VAFKGGACAEGDDGEAVEGADFGNSAYFGGGDGKADDVRECGGVCVFAVAVMFADGFGDRDAISEEVEELGESCFKD
jgi:hypothetical protein